MKSGFLASITFYYVLLDSRGIALSKGWQSKLVRAPESTQAPKHGPTYPQALSFETGLEVFTRHLTEAIC